jgi:cytidine deaminase
MKEKLHQAAIAASAFSHSPYSKYKIGSAVLLSNGKVYSGTNIENASYGGTVCAERVAIWKAVSENQNAKITEICVVSDSAKPWPPCGFCRQVMAEFSNPDTIIHVANLEKIHKSYKLKELLPEAFVPAFLD